MPGVDEVYKFGLGANSAGSHMDANQDARLAMIRVEISASEGDEFLLFPIQLWFGYPVFPRTVIQVACSSE